MSLDYDQVVEALPNYEVGQELGRGGWGVVLSGRHRQLGREVAIKQLPRAFAADGSIRARFTVEAQLLASLDHPHIVPVYDFVEKDGLCLLVMELLPQGTVWSKFTTDGFTAPAAVAVVLACLAGLQAAHDRNVLHRDVKPENLMFSTNGALKVTDFGIAKVLGGEETLATKAGEVVGTPAYIAPEQARGGELSPATDIYATATMLYELMCGALPFPDDGDAMALLFKHAFEPPEPLTDKAPSIPGPIAAVVMSGLATDPAERPQTAEAFGVALATACTDAWGPGWLPTDGTPLMGANTVVAATQRATNPPAAPTVSPTPGGATDSRTTVVPPADGGGPAPATVAREPLAPTPVTGGPDPQPATVVRPPATPTRPTVAAHTRAAVLDDITEPAELVPLHDVVVPPPPPTWFFAAAAVLGIVALVLALVGLGLPTSHGTLPKGSVAVAKTDVTSGATVTVNLSQPTSVVVASSAPSASTVRLSSNVLGQQVATATAPLVPFGSVKVASVHLGGRYLVGGSFTGKVTLLNAGQDVGYWSFPAKTTQIGILSVPGAVTVLLLLFVIAYAESLLRSLRRGKRSVSKVVGLTVVGALFGVDFVGIAWVLAKTQPTATSLVVCAILGAGAGLATALGGVRMGQRRRIRRVQRREMTAQASKVGAP